MMIYYRAAIFLDSFYMSVRNYSMGRKEKKTKANGKIFFVSSSKKIWQINISTNILRELLLIYTQIFFNTLSYLLYFITLNMYVHI